MPGVIGYGCAPKDFAAGGSGCVGETVAGASGGFVGVIDWLIGDGTGSMECLC